MRREYADLKEKIDKLKVGKESPKPIITVGNHTIGDGYLTLIAGPCAVESAAQMEIIAQAVKKAGAHILRGGAYKPRTSPYSFQGLGIDGVTLLKQAGIAFELPIITEVMDAQDVNVQHSVRQATPRSVARSPRRSSSTAHPFPSRLDRGA